MRPDQADIEAAARRIAGLSALRRLSRLMREEDAEERENARRALVLGAFFVVAAGLFALWLLMQAARPA